MRTILILIDVDDDLFDQGAKQFLLVACRSGCCLPHFTQIGAESEQATSLVSAQRSWPLLFAPCKFSFRSLQFAQRPLPFGFETAGDETIVWIDSAIVTFSALRVVVGPLHCETPLCQYSIVISLNPLG